MAQQRFDCIWWAADGCVWVAHRDDTGIAVPSDDYVAAHNLTTEELEAIPHWVDASYDRPDDPDAPALR